MHSRLFIPGPVEVRPAVLQAISVPMIGHRTKEFSALFREVTERLRRVMMTGGTCLVSTSSGSGLMEAAMRNCVRDSVLNTVCGAFSKKWHEIAAGCGKDTGLVSVEWGKAVKPEMVKEALDSGNYDAVCVTHNETSTGVMNPLERIAKVAEKYPETLLLVDAVSSFAGVRIETDRLGIDMLISSSQKALGLPPGLSVASVSDRTFRRAETVEGRGYYFDLLELRKSAEKEMTPYTPSISHMNALNVQLDSILSEGLERRFGRHARLAVMTRKWAKSRGFPIFAERGYESNTVTCMENAPGIDLEKVQGLMALEGYGMDAGYRKLNKKLLEEGRPPTFRIAHMGDLTVEELKGFLGALDESIRKAGG